MGDTAPATPIDAPPEVWDELGVRRETVDGWRAVLLAPFEAALAQGDGFGPESARHHVSQLRDVAAAWRSEGLDTPEGLRWHRAGFCAAQAARWIARGTDLDAAAVAAGHRMVG